MPRPNAAQLLREATDIFSAVGAEIDNLASLEQSASVSDQITLEGKTRTWQREATKVATKLNTAAPYLERGKLEVLRGTSLMLSEIISAEKPKLVTERYHARRESIEQGLVELAR